MQIGRSGSNCPLTARIDAETRSTISSLRLRMIRTVWLATICLAVLSTLAVGKALMTRANSAVAERPADQTTVGTRVVQDTLSKADRLEITYVRQELPATAALQPPRSALQPAELIVPAVSSVTPPVANKIISRHWRDPNAVASATKTRQTRQTAPDKKSKTVDRKSNQAADRSKPADPVKPCSRPGAVGDILRSLKLSPACDS
jgi:hypothetical protein